jgi:hypothetical protein
MESFKAIGYHIKTTFTIPFKKCAAFITYTITALRTIMGNRIIAGSSTNGAANLSHDLFHLSADFLIILPISFTKYSFNFYIKWKLSYSFPPFLFC